MGRKGEFKHGRKAGHTREKTGGLRYAARATAAWVEQNTPQSASSTVPQNSTYEQPGRGAAGESSN